MEQEDYLKRQIDLIARMLGKILSDLVGLKNQGLLSAGIEVTNQALKDELDLDIQELIHKSSDDFISALTFDKNFSYESLDKIASILLLFAENIEDSRKKAAYNNCLALYEYLEKHEKTYSFDRQLKMNRLKSFLV